MAGTQDNGTIRLHRHDGVGSHRRRRRRRLRCEPAQSEPRSITRTTTSRSSDRTTKANTWTSLSPPAVNVAVLSAGRSVGRHAGNRRCVAGRSRVPAARPGRPCRSACRPAMARRRCARSTRTRSSSARRMGRMLRAAWNGTTWTITERSRRRRLATSAASRSIPAIRPHLGDRVAARRRPRLPVGRRRRDVGGLLDRTSADSSELGRRRSGQLQARMDVGGRRRVRVPATWARPGRTSPAACPTRWPWTCCSTSRIACSSAERETAARGPSRCRDDLNLSLKLQEEFDNAFHRAAFRLRTGRGQWIDGSLVVRRSGRTGRDQSGEGGAPQRRPVESRLSTVADSLSLRSSTIRACVRSC